MNPANQVQDGLSWAELRTEFEEERRAVALEILAHSEAWEHLDAEQQRQYLAQVKEADFAALLQAAREIRDESKRAKALSRLAQVASQDLLPDVREAIFDLIHQPTRAEVLSQSLPRLALDSLPYSDWQIYLHLLARRKRSELMEDLARLYPAILQLGGKAAMRGVVAAMGEVCGQWR